MAMNFPDAWQTAAGQFNETGDARRRLGRHFH
jgi:hypothetical protein